MKNLTLELARSRLLGEFPEIDLCPEYSGYSLHGGNGYGTGVWSNYVGDGYGNGFHDDNGAGLDFVGEEEPIWNGKGTGVGYGDSDGAGYNN